MADEQKKRSKTPMTAVQRVYRDATLAYFHMPTTKNLEVVFKTAKDLNADFLKSLGVDMKQEPTKIVNVIPARL